METKSSNTIQNEEILQDDFSRFVELLDGVNRRLGEDIIVAIPTREDERKEKKDATDSERNSDTSSTS